MLCTLVFPVHLKRDHKTITATVTYSNSSYHHVGNAFNFSTVPLQKESVVV